MQKYLFAAICTVMFFSCSTPDKNVLPPDVLNQQEMENVLYDMHLAEGVVSVTPSLADSNARRALGYYQVIYKKYNITEERFKTSYDFYIKNPVMLDSIYNKVIQRLSEQESLLRK